MARQYLNVGNSRPALTTFRADHALHGVRPLGSSCRSESRGIWRPRVMKQKTRNRRKLSTPKLILRLPDLEAAKSAVLNSLSCPDAQRGYGHAIDEFVDWYCSEPRLSFSKTVVTRYRMHLESRRLAPGTINLRLGAVRRLAYEAADCGLLSADLAAGIRRVKGVKKLGMRLGNWLTADQGQALWQAPDRDRIKGKRDRPTRAALSAMSCNKRKKSPRRSLGGIGVRISGRPAPQKRRRPRWRSTVCVEAQATRLGSGRFTDPEQLL
jgi:hypothetical protein